MNLNKKYNKAKLYPIPKGYGRRNKSPVTLLIHSTNGAGNSLFKNEINFLYTSQKVGAEYLVGENEIIEFLDPALYYSWNAGEVNNIWFDSTKTIGIEVHYSPKDKKPIVKQKIDNLTMLVKHLIARFGIEKHNIEMHRTVAPERKIDPSFFTDSQFYDWRNSLYEEKVEMKEYIVTTSTAQVYTSPETKTPATHINDGAVINGLLPQGYRVKGKEVTGQSINNIRKWIWLGNNWGFVFSADVKEYTTITDVPIIGNVNVPVEVLFAALEKYAKHLPKQQKETLVSAYTALGDVTGIGNLYPFCQGAKETAWYSSDRFVKSYNTSGLGADDTGAWGSHFDTVTAGVLAQYAHLLCYAMSEESLNYIQKQLSYLSPRRKEMIKAYGLGAANNTWIGLSQKWNTPKEIGANYGREVVKIANIITGNN